MAPQVQTTLLVICGLSLLSLAAAGRVGPTAIDQELLESADFEVLGFGAAMADSFGVASAENGTNSRRILQSGCPDPDYANPCYAQDGSSFICCSSGCGDFNGNQPTCQGDQAAQQPSPAVAADPPTANPNPIPVTNIDAVFTAPQGSTATPIISGYCPAAMCYVSDGSLGFCCKTQCPTVPQLYPYCAGDNLGGTPSPVNSKPAPTPQVTLIIQPNPNTQPPVSTPKPTPAATPKPTAQPPVSTPKPTNPVTQAPVGTNPPTRDRLYNSYWLIPGNAMPSRSDGWFEVSTNLVNPENFFGLSEQAVFFRTLKHHGDSEWEIHVGPSGHVYSIKIPSTGGAESVCCQAPQTQWMDRVLQSVVSDLRYPGQHFLQQAGSYPQGSPNPFPLYSPNLGVSTSAIDRGISTVTLPQQAPIYQHDLTDKNFWQWVLQFQHLRDIGNGIVEITYVFHNFGPFDLHFIDAPWGGFTFSQFPNYAVGDKTGGWHFEDHSSAWEYTPPKDSASAGWMAFSKTQDPSSAAIGIVYGPNQNSQPWNDEYIRFGRLPSEDLNIVEHIHMNQPWETRPAALPAGGVFYARYYMALNSLQNVANNVTNMQQYVSKGNLQYSAAETGFTSVGAPIPVTNWYPIDHPLTNALPLFLLKYTPTGRTVVSTSPYAFYNTDNSLSPDPRNTQYISFLGWGVKDTGVGAPPGLGAMGLLSRILSQSWFPDPYWGDATVKADVWVGI